MPRLPQPGSDAGTWGNILNDYLSQVHNSDGTLKPGVIADTHVQDATLSPAKLAATAPSSGQVLSYNGTSFEWTTLPSGVTDHTLLSNIGTNSHAQLDTAVADSAAHIASTSNPHAVTKAQVGLANVDNTSDANKPISTAMQAALDGKAAASHTHAQADITNLTTDLAAKEATITAGTTAQYYRGDKSWQTLDKTAVGLANVDNTSDANKPLSTLAKNYVNSRSSGLVTNGSGLLGDNTNFSAFTFTAADRPTGASGSFLGPSSSSTFAGQCDELIAVAPSKYYELSVDARQVTGSARFYLFVAPYDADGLTIQPYNYMAQPNTLTTLAAPLNPGDTTMTLTDASNWNNAAGGATYHRAALFWDYVDAKGYAWPVNTYSRNYTGSNFYADGAISGNTITLNTPYAGVAHPAGTSVSNGSSGGSYMYIGATFVLLDSQWTRYAGRFGGGALAGGTMTYATTQLPMATSSVKVGVLFNYGIVTAPTQQAAANFSLTEVEAGYAQFTGPTAEVRQFALPDASATILTSDAPVTVAQGGTGATTLTGILQGNGTGAVTAVTAPAGALVGTTDTQTLTNKTVDGTANTLANIPQSAVTNLTTDISAKADKLVGINAQTGTAYTLSLTDANRLVTLTNAAAISLTVPANSSVAFAVGTTLKLAQLGAGQVTIVPAAGVTVMAEPGLKIAAQYGGAELIKTDTDTWLLTGRLAV